MINRENLCGKALEMRDRAYTPYSHFNVGAALLCKDGSIYTGCNIENAAYGSTNCAERSAVFSAYSQGYRKEEIEALAIVTEADKLTTPCGACRQVLSELLKPETPIVLSNHLELAVTTIAELLPDSFGAGDLKAEQNR